MIGIVIDVVFVAVAVWIIYSNARNGLISGIFQFAKTILALVAAYFLGGQLGGFFNKTFLEKPIYDFIYGKLNGFYQELGEGFTVEAAIESLPQTAVTDRIVENISGLTEQGEALVASLASGIASPISSFVANVIGYGLVFIASFILLSIAVFFILKALDKVKVIHAVDTVLGGVLGVLVAGAMMLVVSSVFKTFFGGTALYTDTFVMEFLGESGLLQHLKFLNIESLIHF